MAPRVALANLYFDAERYSDAVKWYEEAMKLDARNADVSTDLGVSYYYLNQPDRALEQFEHSLAVNPRHTKTMLNLGIVRAFGKQDLEGASKAWQQVVEIAPASPEGQAAKRALDAMKNAHPDVSGVRRRARRLRRVMSWLIRFVLFSLLFTLVVRAALRFFAGIVEGASAGGARRPRPRATKMVKDPVCGTYVVAQRRPRPLREATRPPGSARPNAGKPGSAEQHNRHDAKARRARHGAFFDETAWLTSRSTSSRPTSSKWGAGCTRAGSSPATTATSRSASPTTGSSRHPRTSRRGS